MRSWFHSFLDFNLTIKHSLLSDSEVAALVRIAKIEKPASLLEFTNRDCFHNCLPLIRNTNAKLRLIWLVIAYLSVLLKTKRGEKRFYDPLELIKSEWQLGN